MGKHVPATTVLAQLDALISRMNALEASSPNEKYTDLLGAVRVLKKKKKHSLGEMEHLKKAIDLLTLELFKVNSRHNSDKKTANQ